MPIDDACRMTGSVIKMGATCGVKYLARWHNKAVRARAVALQLLAEDLVEERLVARELSERATSRAPVEDYDEECIICLDNARDYTFSPCGHRVSCVECAERLRVKSTLCPWCRAEGE